MRRLPLVSIVLATVTLSDWLFRSTGLQALDEIVSDKMRILHTADLHLEQHWFDWVASHAAEYDVLAIAGDLQNAFSSVSMCDQAVALRNWLLKLPTQVIVCSGNHDFWEPPRTGRDDFAAGGWGQGLRGHGNVIGADGDEFVLGANAYA